MEEWEKSASSRIKAENTVDEMTGSQKAQASVDPLTLWLRRNGVMDKDAMDDEETPAQRRARLAAKKPDGVLDLHGLSKEEALVQLEAFFTDAHQKGYEKVLVIHGKGNHSEREAVLKHVTREFIEQSALTGEFGHAPKASGGSGATWAFLRL